MHWTLLNEFYRVAFRKRLYASLDALQTDLDALSRSTTRGVRIKDGGAIARRRLQTFFDSLAVTQEKAIT